VDALPVMIRDETNDSLYLFAEGTLGIADPFAVLELDVASRGMLAMLVGGSFLKETMATEPAVANNLAKAVNSVAITLEWMGIIYLAGNQTHGVIDPLKDKGAEIDKLCEQPRVRLGEN
jgi:hypothetical protein